MKFLKENRLMLIWILIVLFILLSGYFMIFRVRYEEPMYKVTTRCIKSEIVTDEYKYFDDDFNVAYKVYIDEVCVESKNDTIWLKPKQK